MMTNAPRFWIGVACRAHVEIGVTGGFCQLGHGKLAPVKRLKRGDGLIYYSPRETLGGNDKVQAFTAIGQILDDIPYQVEQNPGFCPMRRNISYQKSKITSIRGLLSKMEFTKEYGASWGMVFRRGSFQIGRNDFNLIAESMCASTDPWSGKS